MIRIPGSHVPNIKNRSSKHLLWHTGMKPAVRSMSNEALSKLSGSEVTKEIKRRRDKAAKRDMKNS